MEKRAVQTNTQVIIFNGLLAALYIILTVVVAPVAQGPIQFRISESLNHIVVFNKKLLWGVFGGVVMFNLFFSTGGLLDVLFGGGQTLLALLLTAYSEKWIKDTKKRMVFNTIAFSLSMILIAIMICILSNQAIGSAFFWGTYGSLFLSELVIMSVSAPMIYYVNKYVHFDRI
ncbi:QueT transporter family protein [Vagococcus carniphilus]|uniref:QueT transporter family protein n=1 Tax=Vagococcus carniphilus TaxID=218144 RepID=A0A430B984_9ENTE|nr:QueT transporter family protein [Vagococcus carniphilus]MDT2829918.1 QueT transporter family protein [Vagococcus carniphilus]MDT2834772.1 QueT transporter family protein [Vagococcus carniphilus]MDT2838352.1 QueT transporter family protein [Vagococcus carniphilus]MDT2849686.1 QueT transporter family protein [Vagococcus carniphilus]MDT2854348.1 QueT transporter family protein [Vagococcus carniphilus]